MQRPPEGFATWAEYYEFMARVELPGPREAKLSNMQRLRGQGYDFEGVKGTATVDGWWRVTLRGAPVGGQKGSLEEALAFAEKHRARQAGDR